MTWRGVSAALRPGARLGQVAAGDAASGTADAPGRVLNGLAGGIAEPSFVPDGTVSLAAPSAVLGTNAASMLTTACAPRRRRPGSRCRPQGAAAAEVIDRLDALAESAGKLSSSAATNLAAETSTPCWGERCRRACRSRKSGAY